MKRTKLTSILAASLILIAGLTGCGKDTTANLKSSTAPESSIVLEETGGVLTLKVNPEIAISYDADGNVTKLEARNADAKEILDAYTGYEGKACDIVVQDLVAEIGEAGYFVEEIEGESRQIVIEIEKGSKLPSDTFLDEVVESVKLIVSQNDWTSPLEIKNETDYGITDYVDTDYGPDNDGVTDYDDTDYGPNNDGVTDYDDNSTDYGATDYNSSAPAAEESKPVSNTVTSKPAANNSTQGTTDYDDTDYGPNNDGVTDYDDTDYGPNNDGVTDYDDTDYGPNNDGVTDYDDTNYDDSNDDDDDDDDNDNDDNATDYGATDYGTSDYDK